MIRMGLGLWLGDCVSGESDISLVTSTTFSGWVTMRGEPTIPGLALVDT